MDDYFSESVDSFAGICIVPLIGEIQSQIISNISDGNKAKEYFEKAKNISGGLLRRAIPVAIKIITAGVVDLDDISEELLKELSEVAEEKINSYEKDQKTIKEFRTNLEDFAKEISLDSKKPIVFFIDELDRCRPDYAIELLERIKHLFNVPGIVYVLVLDINQLESAVQTLYGLSMNFDGYIRRFIDLQYQLPKSSTTEFCTRLFEQFGFSEYFKNRSNGQYESQELMETLTSVFDIFDLSLRVQEQCFTQLSIALHTIPNNQRVFQTLLGFLISLKLFDQQIYDDYINKYSPAESVLQTIRNRPDGERYLESISGRGLEAYLVSAHANYDLMGDLIKRYRENSIDESRSKTERSRDEKIASILTNFYNQDQYNYLDYLGKKINLIDGFVSITD